MIFYAFTIFWSAFLLFLVQPILGKQLLPRFGGTPAVWTTCLLFFQTLLLAGYVYAHGLNAWLRPRAQAIVHCALLAGSLWVLPIAIDPTYRVKLKGSPTWQILAMLTLTVGAPYLLLSATGPLLQAWFAKTHARAPYRLYALSNVGSLLALLSYPFVVEPKLNLGAQTWNWTLGYGLFFIVCAMCAVQLYLRGESATTAPADESVHPAGAAANITLGTKFFWLALSTTASAMLMATTNQICQEVAVAPFLWILPLVLYLLSFIICFDRPHWYSRRFFLGMLVAFSSQAVLILYLKSDAPIVAQLVVYSTTLFACAMVCHGELVQSRPPASHLTMYYLLIAAGGAIGGLFVAIMAPLVFSGYWEYHLTLWGSWVLALVALARDPESMFRRREMWWFWLAALLALTVLSFALVKQVRDYRHSAIATTRDFYGTLLVSDEMFSGAEPMRGLVNGATTHGEQFLSPQKKRLPISYYDVNSGVGYAILRHPLRTAEPTADGAPPASMKIGVIGLGVGTIAAYGRPQDEIRFYEINPEVERLSNEYFTYRSASPAKVEVEIGDARLVLEQELESTGPRLFDLLVLDAFNSDAVPMHLLTRECNEIYWKHLKPDGILAVHISNRNLDLAPVVHALAQHAGKQAIFLASDGDDHRGNNSGARQAFWMLVTSNQDFLYDSEVRRRIRYKGKELTDADPSLLWTDDYGSLWQVIRGQ